MHLVVAGAIPVADGAVERWQVERDRIAAWVAEECLSEDLGAYVMAPGSTALDTSVLLHAESGFHRGERMSRTIDALTAQLAAGALACLGRHDETIAAMDELVAMSNDIGLYSEMISARDDGSFWGNLPQALSHLAVVTAASTIRQVVPPKALEGH